MVSAAPLVRSVRHRAYRLAFEVEVFNAVPRIASSRLAVAETDELMSWFRQAWSDGDLGETARIGEMLWGRRRLRPGDVCRLRRVLTMLDRPEDALTVVHAGPVAPIDLVTLIKAGRSGDARESLAALDPSVEPDAVSLLRRALGDARGPEQWDAETGALAAALDLGCGDLAAELAAESLALAGPAPDDFETAMELLHASFRLAGRGASVRLLEAIGPLFSVEDRPAWQAVRQLACGGPDEGAVMEARAQERSRFLLAHLLTSACAAIGRPEAAARRLCRFGHTDLKGTEHLAELARLVAAAERLAPRYAASSARRRIFDVFPFNGEFMLLDLKLAAMADWVDAFVLVEAPRTFTDRPKPLYFKQAKDRYAAWAHKIVHVVADEPPPFVQSTWAREYHQRDQGVRGLSDLCAPEDLVLISDVDEIVDPAALEGFGQPYATLGMRTFQYFLNFERVGLARQERKVGVVEARMLQASGLSSLRVGMWAYSRRRVADAGWHFSYVLTPEEAELKTLSYSHEEHQHPETKSTYARNIEQIRAGHPHPGFTRVPIDPSFPEVLQTRPEAFAQFILPDAGPQ